MVQGGVNVKQASLMEYGVAAAPVTILSRVEETEPSKLTAVIVEFEPATYECCSLCNRWAVLHFCLEYLDGEGDIVLWGHICEQCRNRVMAEKGDS